MKRLIIASLLLASPAFAQSPQEPTIDDLRSAITELQSQVSSVSMRAASLAAERDRALREIAKMKADAAKPAEPAK